MKYKAIIALDIETNTGIIGSKETLEYLISIPIEITEAIIVDEILVIFYEVIDVYDIVEEYYYISKIHPMNIEIIRKFEKEAKPMDNSSKYFSKINKIEFTPKFVYIDNILYEINWGEPEYLEAIPSIIYTTPKKLQIGWEE